MFLKEEEEALKLGFDNVDEMLLCRDLCGFDSVPISDRERLLKQCYDDSVGKTKQDFLEYMQENNLIDLFNKVKKLPHLERYIEIYNYFYNTLELSDIVLGKYNRKVKEARELFDGELEEEYSKKAQKLFIKMQRYIYRKRDMEIIGVSRLENSDQKKFYAYIETLEEHRQDMKNIGRGKK